MRQRLSPFETEGCYGWKRENGGQILYGNNVDAGIEMELVKGRKGPLKLKINSFLSGKVARCVDSQSVFRIPS